MDHFFSADAMPCRDTAPLPQHASGRMGRLARHKTWRHHGASFCRVDGYVATVPASSNNDFMILRIIIPRRYFRYRLGTGRAGILTTARRAVPGALRLLIPSQARLNHQQWPLRSGRSLSWVQALSSLRDVGTFNSGDNNVIHIISGGTSHARTARLPAQRFCPTRGGAATLVALLALISATTLHTRSTT